MQIREFFQAMRETEIGKEIKLNAPEKILLSCSVVLTAASLATSPEVDEFFKQIDFPKYLNSAVYISAVISLAFLIGYRFKRCYDRLKEGGY